VSGGTGAPNVILCYQQTYPALDPIRVVCPPSCPFVGTDHGPVPVGRTGQEERRGLGEPPRVDLHGANPQARPTPVAPEVRNQNELDGVGHMDAWMLRMKKDGWELQC